MPGQAGMPATTGQPAATSDGTAPGLAPAQDPRLDRLVKSRLF
jgi:hypothetical protein